MFHPKKEINNMIESVDIEIKILYGYEGLAG